jgi:hypothetical protein
MSDTLKAALLAVCLIPSLALADDRELVQMPEPMQIHMLSNMRDHLASLDEILALLADNKTDKAAEVAEHRLGVSSLEAHGAAHMAKYMPKGMQQAGNAMHKAATAFALKAQEGELLPAYRALKEVTSSCVACHAAYRVR